LWRKINVIVESTIAFILILTAASVVYALGRRAAPKPVQSENERSTYACGEKIPLQKLKLNVTLSKYLIYFVVLDSSVLLLAFATLVTQGVNMPLMMLYLALMLASSLLLYEGGKEQ
jgi:NADH:ubiquinone oxidoreductase subunit 3 (subunit A)